MGSVKNYLNRLRKSVFHKGEAFALEGGYFFGPGSDPKGSFYNPKLSIFWFQPNSAAVLEETAKDRGVFKNWLSKLGSLKKTA